MLTPKLFKPLTISFRGLSSVIYRNFGIYTNETLKRNFDDKVKQKYFAQKRQQQQESEEESENEDLEQGEHDEMIYSEMRKAYEQAFNEIEDEGESILNAYKSQVDPDRGDLEFQQRIAKDARFMGEAQAHFKGISTSEFLKRSKNLIDATKTKQAWTPKQKGISDEYLEYDKYKKNFARFRDVMQTDKEASEEFSLGASVREFMVNLDKNMQERKALNHLNDEIGEGERDPAKLKQDIEEYWEEEGIDPREEEEEEDDRGDINIGQNDQEFENPKVFGRMSPWAREELFKLHKEGWTVRDLSLRFGLLPERVKAIIWNKQYFYDEVLPNSSLAAIKMGMEREMLYSLFYPWVDYGKDLELLEERDRGVFFQRYRRTEIDANPPKAVKDLVEKALEKQSKKKYDIVTENFVGTGHKGYFVKSWIVNNGHGSERVNKKFKMALEQVNKTHLMPDKMRAKLKKGPRIASKGFGIQ